MHKKIILSCLFVIFLMQIGYSTNFRIMTYNSLNYDGTDRTNYFLDIIAEIDPDIILMQEIKNESAVNIMLTSLQTLHSDFSKASFWDDGDQNSMLFYRSGSVSYLSQNYIETWPRDILEYKLSIDNNIFYAYSCHLKASTGTTNENHRLAAVNALRSHLETLPENSEFIIAGDMNIYTAQEPSYQKFIADETDNSGRAEDLCTEIGNWHENNSLRHAHTQSTRTTSFGGGATGGLDDRFDFIFSNYGLNNGSGIEYQTGSYTNFGNDGNHFNTSIVDGANSVVSADIASALHQASDHLPVFADFTSLSGIQTTITIFQEDFEINNFVSYSIIGNQVWETASYGNTPPCAKMSGFVYGSGAYQNDDWLISPALDFTGLQNIALDFEEAINFEDGSIADNEEVYISTDYVGNGNPSNANWTELNVSGRASGNSWTFTNVDQIDLSAWNGQDNIYLAFRYQSSNTNAATWEIDNVIISGETIPLEVDFSANKTQASTGESIQFTNLSTGGTLPYTYSWDFDNDGFEDSALENPIFSYSEPGIYSVSLSVTDASTSLTEIKTDFIRIVEYNSSIFIFQEDFNVNDFSTHNITGAQVWEMADYGNPLPCAKMSGYDNGTLENEDWLISPALNFVGLKNITLDFDEAINYETISITNNEEVYISNQYSGNGIIELNDWSKLSVSGRASGNSWSFTNVNQIDLSDWDDQDNIYLAFRYQSSNTNAATWEIDNVVVAGELLAPQNLTISQENDLITLTWNAVNFANSYYVYESDTPNFVPSSETLIAQVGNTTFSKITSSNKLFYLVVASTNSID